MASHPRRPLSVLRSPQPASAGDAHALSPPSHHHQHAARRLSQPPSESRGQGTAAGAKNTMSLPPNAAPTSPATAGAPLPALTQLATANGVSLSMRQTTLLPPASPPQWATGEDVARATELLAAEKRRSEKNFKDPSKKLKHRFKSSAKKEKLDQAENWEYSFAERCHVLEQLVADGAGLPMKGSVGVVQAVLEFKGDGLLSGGEWIASAVASPTSPLSPTSQGVGKAVMNVSTRLPSGGSGGAVPVAAAVTSEEEWMANAAGTGNIQLVQLLASRGISQAALDRGLDIAIISRSLPGQLQIVEELIRYGADINGHGDVFMKVVEEGRADLVRALLRGRHSLQPAYLNAALVTAEKLAFFDLVAILLAHGADLNYQAAQAFLSSVKAEDLKMTSLLLAGAQNDSRLRLQYLDHAVALVIQSQNPRAVYDFLNLLLCAGASTNAKPIEDQLFIATRSGDMALVKMMLHYGVPADHGAARCLQAALETRDLVTLSVLLDGTLHPPALSQSIPQAMAFSPRDQRLRVMKLLLAKGAHGQEVDQALVDAVLQEDSKLFAEILSNSANINYRNGVSIKAALQARNPAYLQQLCGKGALEFSTADHVLPIAMQPDIFEESRARYVIKACKGHTILLDKLLSDEVTLNGSRDAVLRMLLENGASVDSSNGSALYQAVVTGNASAVRTLVDTKPSLKTLCSAFRAATTLQEAAVRMTIMDIILDKTGSQKVGQDDALVQEAGTSTYNGTDIVALLLKHNASVDHGDGAALKAAVRAKSVETMDLILFAQPGLIALTGAFAAAMELSPASRLQIAKLIGEQAISSDLPLDVGMYLPPAIAEGDVELCQLLLHYGADPNLADGKAFVDAAQLGDSKTFKTLLGHQPDVQRLLPALIRGVHDEDKLVVALEMSFKHLHVLLDPSENVLLFLALDRFEQGHKLVKFLLDAGCSVGAVRDLSLRGGEVEAVTPLIWALSRPLPGPSKLVLSELMDRGIEAKPDFVTPVTRTTALLEAAQSGRHFVLSKLIALGARVNAQDRDGRSVLLMASEAGDVQSVKALLTARVRPNDGSLHAAARSANEEIVNLLLDNRHSPNHIHSGRSALAEICRNGHPDHEDWTDRAYWVINSLIARGANIDTRFAGKNLLHLAMDNDAPVPILKVLLDFPQFSEHLNDDSLFYEDAVSTVYSPRSYVEAFNTGSPAEKAQLIKMFEDKNCHRNTWNRQGRHPANYTYNTLPAHLKSQVDAEKLEELHAEKQLKRRQEESRLQQDLADRNHSRALHQAAEREGAEAAATARRHALERKHQQDLAASHAATLHAQHQLQMNQHSALATQRQQIEDRDRQRAYAHQAQMNSLEAQRERERAAAAKQISWEADQSEERRLARQVRLLDRQDASVTSRAERMKEVAAAAGHTNAGPSGAGNANGQKMLGFGEEWAQVD